MKSSTCVHCILVWKNFMSFVLVRKALFFIWFWSLSLKLLGSIWHIFCCLFVLFCFVSTGICTQRFALARWASTTWAIPPTLFCFGYFGDKGLAFCPGRPGLWSSYFMLPTIAGMIGTCHHAQLFFRWDGGLMIFFAWAGLKQWTSKS
jgi:hypothetical protein